MRSPPRERGDRGLTGGDPAFKIEGLGSSAGFLFAALPPRSMVGQLPVSSSISGFESLGGNHLESTTYSSQLLPKCLRGNILG